MGLYGEEESGNEENIVGLRDLDENECQAAWAQIGEGIYNPSSTKSTKLRDPLYRYIHRLLTYSLNQRHDSSGVVGLKDLVVLHCIHNQISNPNNATTVMALVQRVREELVDVAI